MLTNQLNVGLPIQAWIKKTVSSEDIHWLTGKEKVSGAAVCKEANANSLLGHESIAWKDLSLYIHHIRVPKFTATIISVWKENNLDTCSRENVLWFNISFN